MATKAQYLTALTGLSYIQEVGTPVEVSSETISEINYTVYDVYVLERDNGNGISVKHRFVVYDEGGGSEEVLTEYVPVYQTNLTGYSALITKIESIPNIKNYWIKKIDTDMQVAVVRTMIFDTDHVVITWYLIYIDSGLQYAVIINPEDF